MLTGEEKKGKLESKEKNLLMNNAILTKKLFSNKFGESKAVILQHLNIAATENELNVLYNKEFSNSHIDRI